jgi:hypothetical protein
MAAACRWNTNHHQAAGARSTEKASRVLSCASASILVNRNNHQMVVRGNVKERDMSTAEQMVNSAVGLVSRLQNRAPLADRSNTVDDGPRMRHLIASRRAEAVRLADRALWSQHNADAAWYAGKLRAARQLDAQAARQRDLAAWLTAEADALTRA